MSYVILQGVCWDVIFFWQDDLIFYKEWPKTIPARAIKTLVIG